MESALHLRLGHYRLMIDEKSVILWRKNSPSLSEQRVLQDLALARALVEIYNNPYLQEVLVFRQDIVPLVKGYTPGTFDRDFALVMDKVVRRIPA